MSAQGEGDSDRAGTRRSGNRLVAFWKWLATPAVPLAEDVDNRSRLALRVLRLLLAAMLLVVVMAASDRRNPIVNLASVYGPTGAVFCALIAAAKRE